MAVTGGWARRLRVAASNRWPFRSDEGVGRGQGESLAGGRLAGQEQAVGQGLSVGVGKFLLIQFEEENVPELGINLS
jgi:hypothetical protein